MKELLRYINVSNISVEILNELIEKYQDIAEFGMSQDAVDPSWYQKAEQEINLKFTDSYLWFLKNYAHGEICGDEVYSIYGMEFDEAVGGDIVYLHKINLEDGTTKPNELVVTATNFGEVYFFNYSEFDGKECPIYLRYPSGESEFYAQDFYEFLYKRIIDCIS